MRIFVALCLIGTLTNGLPYEVTYGKNYRQSQRSQDAGIANTFDPIGKSNYHIPFQVLEETPVISVIVSLKHIIINVFISGVQSDEISGLQVGMHRRKY